jgi:hypothetical protein
MCTQIHLIHELNLTLFSYKFTLPEYGIKSTSFVGLDRSEYSNKKE